MKLPDTSKIDTTIYTFHSEYPAIDIRTNLRVWCCQDHLKKSYLKEDNKHKEMSRKYNE